MKCVYIPISICFFECLPVLQRGSWPWFRKGSQSTNDSEDEKTNGSANNSKICLIL